MRVVLLETKPNRYHPPTRSLRYTLEQAGHQVLVVQPGNTDPEAGVLGVTDYPIKEEKDYPIKEEKGWRQKLTQRLGLGGQETDQDHPAWSWPGVSGVDETETGDTTASTSSEPETSHLDSPTKPSAPARTAEERQAQLHQNMAETLEALQPDLIYPGSPEAQQIATSALTGMVVRAPTDRSLPLNRDLLLQAPRHPELAGPIPSRYKPGITPNPPRDRAGKVVVVYRHQPYSPGRYLAEGFRLLGLEVHTPTVVNWEQIGAWDPLGVVIVESVLPPFLVTGTNPGIPVVFWVHHGEHHLSLNLRLRQRYGAHLVALAHSWHLSHRLPGPVERLPFGVPEELFPEPVPWEERTYDLAVVGNNLRHGGPHRQRQQLLREAQQTLGTEQVKLAEGVSPEEMAAIYSDSRMVLNEGGTRHLPVTMRVFEAIGAGALLISDPVPGLDLLLEPDREFVPLRFPLTAQLKSLLADRERASQMAQDGAQRGKAEHSYRQRADDLCEMFDRLRQQELPKITSPKPPESPLLRAVVDEVDAQRILVAGTAPNEPALADRDLWEMKRLSRPPVPDSYEATLIPKPVSPRQLTRAVAAARRNLFLPTHLVGQALEFSGGGEVDTRGEAAVVTLGRSGYRSPLSHPETGSQDAAPEFTGKLYDLSQQPELDPNRTRIWVAPENYYQTLPSAPPEAPLPAVTVVTPVYNRLELLERTLAGLTTQTYPAELVEVVVSNDGSEEDLEPVLSRYQDQLTIRRVDRERQGFGAGAARNLGAAHARGDVLVFIDSDCLPHPELVATYVGWHQRADNLVVMGPRLGVDTTKIDPSTIKADSILPWFDPDHHPSPVLERRLELARRTLGLQRGDQAYRAVVSSNFSMLRLTFSESGGFSEDFRRWGGEDIELGWRLYQAGNFLVWEPEAQVLHQTQAEKTQEGWRLEDWAKNHPLMATKMPHRFYRRPQRWFRYQVPKLSWIAHPADPAQLQDIFSQLHRQLTSDWELIGIGQDPRLTQLADLIGADGRFSVAPDFGQGLCRSQGELVGIVDGRLELERQLSTRVISRLETYPRVGILRVPYRPPEGETGLYRRIEQIQSVDDQLGTEGLPILAFARRRELIKAWKLTRSPQKWWELTQKITPSMILDNTPITLPSPVPDHPTPADDPNSPQVVSPPRSPGSDPSLTPESVTWSERARPVSPPTDTESLAADSGLETDSSDQSDQIVARYVGWTGNQNLGDEALYLSVQKLLSWARVTDRGIAGKLLILGGGTLLNRGYLKHLLPHDLPRVERVIMGTGVANPDYWGTPWEKPEEWLEFLSTCGYVGVRGPMSAQILRDWGWDGPLEIVGDPALFLPTPDGARDPERVLVCPAWTKGLLWGDSDQVVQQVLAEMVSGLSQRGYRVEMLSANPLDDRMVFEIIRQAGLPDLPYHPGYNMTIENAMNLLSSVGVVVAERLHGAVLAAAAGTPFVALEYRPKVRDFARSLDLDQLAIRTDQISADQLIRTVTETDWREIRTRMGTAVEEYRKRLLNASDLIRQLC